jgi:hypothetical protein
MWGESRDQDVEARRHHRARISFHSLVSFEAAGGMSCPLVNGWLIGTKPSIHDHGVGGGLVLVLPLLLILPHKACLEKALLARPSTETDTPGRLVAVTGSLVTVRSGAVHQHCLH